MNNKITVFSSHKYDEVSMLEANARVGSPFEFVFVSARLSLLTAVLAKDSACIVAFVNDNVDKPVLELLASMGVRGVMLRCAGFNQVDLAVAASLNMSVLRVPAYSPHAVAEHAVALILALNRKIVKAQSRVREGDFMLDGLLGFDLHGKTVSIIGTGGIGTIMATIMKGFGCVVLGYDPYPNPAVFEKGVGGTYVGLDEALARADIVSLHVPLMPSTRHLIDEEAVGKMKTGVMIINTARGALLDTQAIIRGLKSRKIGSVGLDVIEGEESMFFEDHSEDMIDNDAFHRLCTFNNVIITAHMAFFTKEALANIADTTIANVSFLRKEVEEGRALMGGGGEKSSRESGGGEDRKKTWPKSVCVHEGEVLV